MKSKFVLLQPLIVLALVARAQAVDKKGHSAEAWKKVDSGRAQEALHIVDEVVRGGERTAINFAIRARALNELKRYDEAIEAANRAIAIDKNCAAAWHALAMCSWARHEDDLALAYLTRATLILPRFPHAHAVMAQIHADHQRWRLSMKEARLALADDQFYTDCVCIFAHCAAQVKEYRQALSVLNKQLKHNPDDLRPLRHRASIYKALKMYNEEIEDLSRLVRAETKDSGLFHARGEAYAATAKWKEAIADLDRALELEPKLAHAAAVRANAKLLLRRFEEAIEDAELAVKLDPAYGDAYLIGASAYCEIGRPEKGLKFVEPLKKLYEAAYYRMSGICLKKMHRYDEALAYINKAVALSPLDGNSYFERGCIYEEMIEDQKAFADYAKAAELMPDSDSVIDARNRLAREVGRPEVAEKALGDKVKAEGHNPNVKLEYARSLIETGKHAQAIAVLNQLAPGSTDSTVFGLRANCYMALRQFDKAIADFNMGEKRSDGSWRLYKSRADCHAALGKYREAIRDFSEAIRRKPMVTSVYRDRAQMHQKLGDSEAARRDLQHAKDLERDL